MWLNPIFCDWTQRTLRFNAIFCTSYIHLLQTNKAKFNQSLIGGKFEWRRFKFVQIKNERHYPIEDNHSNILLVLIPWQLKFFLAEPLGQFQQTLHGTFLVENQSIKCHDGDCDFSNLDSECFPSQVSPHHSGGIR